MVASCIGAIISSVDESLMTIAVEARDCLPRRSFRAVDLILLTGHVCIVSVPKARGRLGNSMW